MNLKSISRQLPDHKPTLAPSKSLAPGGIRLKSDDILFVPARRRWTEPVGLWEMTEAHPPPDGRPSHPETFRHVFISQVHICELLTIDGYRYFSEIK